MSVPRKALVAGVAAFALFVAGHAAFASHGRVGLWNVTMTLDQPVQPMPDLSRLPPQAQAQMRAMMGGHGNAMTVQHCMTRDEVMNDVPHLDPKRQEGCTLGNVVHLGHTMSADVTCTRDFQGTEHVEFTFDSDTHYAGRVVMNGQVHGHAVNHTTLIEGHWLSSDCGAVTH